MENNYNGTGHPFYDSLDIQREAERYDGTRQRVFVEDLVYTAYEMGLGDYNLCLKGVTGTLLIEDKISDIVEDKFTNNIWNKYLKLWTRWRLKETEWRDVYLTCSKYIDWRRADDITQRNRRIKSHNIDLFVPVRYRL